jgi:hypothetical protein
VPNLKAYFVRDYERCSTSVTIRQLPDEDAIPPGRWARTQSENEASRMPMPQNILNHKQANRVCDQCRGADMHTINNAYSLKRKNR